MKISVGSTYLALFLFVFVLIPVASRASVDLTPGDSKIWYDAIPEKPLYVNESCSPGEGGSSECDPAHYIKGTYGVSCTLYNLTGKDQYECVFDGDNHDSDNMNFFFYDYGQETQAVVKKITGGSQIWMGTPSPLYFPAPPVLECQLNQCYVKIH